MPEPDAKSLEERKFEADEEYRKKELALRKREIRAREIELKRGKYSNPLIIGLIAAGFGLIGNFIVSWWNGKAALQNEEVREHAELIISAVPKPTTLDDSCRIIILFEKAGVYDNLDKKLTDCTRVPAVIDQSEDIPTANPTPGPPQDLAIAPDAVSTPTALAISAYQSLKSEYDSSPSPKALVISDGGWVGEWSQPGADISIVKKRATWGCVRRARQFDPCHMVSVNGSPIGPWKTE